MAGSVQDAVFRLRQAGVVVHEWGGWAGRGNGSSHDWRGGIVHHTATAYGSAFPILVDGRSDLSGPLCNFSGNADGSVTVIADGVANHAGASGGYSMGPLPVTSNFNRLVMGLEIVYPGTSPMTPEQYHTACIWAKVVANVVAGGNIQVVRAHAETSVTGKWDPGYAPSKTIDMGRFRADADVVLNPTPPPPKPKWKSIMSSYSLEYGKGPHHISLAVEVGSNSRLIKNLYMSLISGYDGLDDVLIYYVGGEGPQSVGHLNLDQRFNRPIPSGTNILSIVYTCPSDNSRPTVALVEEPY